MRPILRSFLPSFLLVAAWCFIAQSSGAQTILYVKTGGTGDASSWANASGDLKATIDGAGVNTEIWVAAGTYYPTNNGVRSVFFSLKNEVAIYGGFDGSETLRSQRNSIANVTILSGDIDQDNTAANNSFHVVENVAVYSNALLDGFTITGGNADADFAYHNGGGMYNKNSAPILTNCIFQGNAALSGGGVYNENSNPVITNCSFLQNTASSGGGMNTISTTSQVSNPVLTGCSFQGNTAGNGGASYTQGGICGFTDCSFQGNSASYGGGIYSNGSASRIFLENCTFSGNTASGSGVISGVGSFTSVNNCTISNNSGGAIENSNGTMSIAGTSFTANSGNGISTYYAKTTIDRCRFLSTNGYAIYNRGNSTGGQVVYISNSVFWGNSGGISIDNIFTYVNLCSFSQNNTGINAYQWNGKLSNSILWGNTTETYILVDIFGGIQRIPEITNNIIKGSSSDPLFLDAANGNLHVQTCSPAVNTGSDVFDGTDLDGNTRTIGGTVDIGAYESQLKGSGCCYKILYVKKDAAGNGYGTSWFNAFTNLQDALAEARHCPNVTQVWVAGGTYFPDEGTGLTDNDRTLSFNLKSGLAVYGGFAGNETLLSQRNLSANPTILSGDIDQDSSPTNNAFHVMLNNGADATAVLDGFTITGGNANGSSPNNAGAGMYNVSSSPTLINCIVLGNAASAQGGGIYNELSSPTFTNCTFSLNTALIYGGGIANLSSSPTLTNCSFSANTASQGAGLFNDASSPVLTNCILWGDAGGEINGGIPSVSYSMVQGGFSGTANIDKDPQFVDAGSGNLHLQACSPAVNKGLNSAFTGTFDQDGKPRLIGGIIDMGAYESSITGRTLYVKKNATGNNNGSSWADAYNNLQDALAETRNCPNITHQVWVAGGTYYPDEGGQLTNNDRTQYFNLQTRVAIYGGFAGTETQLTQRNLLANPTVLSGEIDQVAGNSGNSFHVLKGIGVDTTAILDGFTIAAGNANSASPDNSGGGLYLESSTPILTNCSFIENSAINGGGIYNNTSSPVIINGRFWKNSATTSGGGIANFSSSPVVTNCTFSLNTASNGGGISNDNSSPTLTNCILWGDTNTEVYTSTGSPNIFFSIVQGGFSGWGNSNRDPLFEDAASGNLHLPPCSPAINKGLNSADTLSTDIEGNARVIGNVIDMGAWEATNIICCPPGNIFYVSQNAAGNNNGTSWEDAFNNLQDALTQADKCSNVTQVWVAAGTYYPNNGVGIAPYDRSVSFNLRKRLAIYGGFSGNETALAERNPNRVVNRTVLSSNTDYGIYFSYHVIQSNGLDSTATLDGFVIENGAANGASFPNSDGGGMLNTYSSPTIVNCTFRNNRAMLGGAVSSVESEPRFINCDFQANSTLTNGIGGVFYFESGSLRLTNCNFSGNFGTYGGAIYAESATLIITNCLFADNGAVSGGALYNSNDVSSIVLNTRFLRNHSTSTAGAIYNNSSSPLVVNCSFIQNYSYNGGLFVDYFSNPFLVNCSFSANYATNLGLFFGIGSSPTLTNCILWGNTGALSANETPVINHSIVQGGYPGNGNLDADPLFVSPADLHLQQGSPAINAGDDAANTINSDLDGNTRKIGIIDMGAYEAGLVFSTYYRDLDGDGFGNANDSLKTLIKPVGYTTNKTDCNDADAGIHEPVQYFVDADHDGFGSTATELVCASTAPVGYSTNNTDCNDNDATINSAKTYYVDADKDGYGSATTALLCSSNAPVGYSTNNSDCNDNDASIHPGATEICDGKDNDCNGITDDLCYAAIIAKAGTTAASACLDDGTITLSATGGKSPYTYSINGTTYQAVNKFTALAAGAFTGYVKDTRGAIGTLSITVAKVAANIVSSSVVYASACLDDGKITLGRTGGTSPYTFSIDGTNYFTSNIFSNLAAGTYTGYVKDGKGCAGIKTDIIVGKTAAILVTASVVSATACTDDGKITLSRTGGTSPFTFSINGTNYFTSNIFSNLAAGTYTGYVKDAKGCIGTKTGIIVGRLGGMVVSAGTTIASACLDDGKITLGRTGGVSPYVYSIDGTNYFISNIFSNLAAGTYTGYVKDSKGCIASKPDIIVGKTAAIIVSAGTVNASGCLDDGKITLGRTGGTSPFTFSIDGINYFTGNIFSNLAAGTYTGYVKDGKGCIGTKTGIIVGKTAAIVVSASAVIASACLDDGKITLGRTGGISPFTFSVDGASYFTGNIFSNLAAGTYTGYVKDAKGCIGTKTDIVVGKTAAVVVSFTKTNSTTCPANGIVTLYKTGGTSPYTYSIDGVNYVTTNKFINLAPGTYTGYVKDAKCDAVALPGIAITGPVCGGTEPVISMGKKMITENIVSIAPNPASNIANLQLTGYNGVVNIKLMTAEGKMLQERKHQLTSAATQQIEVNVAGYTSGTYLVIITDEKGNIKTEKLMVIH